MGGKYVLLILCITYILWNFYNRYKKPLKTIKDYRKRALAYRFSIFPSKKKKAIDVLKEALKIEDLSELDKSLINADIGQLYFEFKEYGNAVEYFDCAIDTILQKDIYYSRIVNDIVEAYYYAGHKERAKELYNDFVQREKYDSKFLKVKNLEFLFKD